jgi:quercetin dioxygenase-like cupin family protein
MSSSASDKTDAETTPGMDPDRRERLRGRLLDRAGSAMLVTRDGDSKWQAFLPGIRLKILSTDPTDGVQTALWRLDPGARIPAHPHRRDEECYILEGVLELNGERYQGGDYMLAPAGSRHPSIHSPEGALMLIRGERVSWRERLFLRAALAMGR